MGKAGEGLLGQGKGKGGSERSGIGPKILSLSVDHVLNGVPYK